MNKEELKERESVNNDFYKKLAEKYEQQLVECHEAVAKLVTTMEKERPSLTSTIRSITESTKDAVNKKINEEGYVPNLQK